MVYKHSVFRIYFVVDKPSIDNEQSDIWGN